jgi:hypothetical protein
VERFTSPPGCMESLLLAAIYCAFDNLSTRAWNPQVSIAFSFRRQVNSLIPQDH